MGMEKEESLDGWIDRLSGFQCRTIVAWCGFLFVEEREKREAPTQLVLGNTR
jgi:hypothetical protein